MSILEHIEQHSLGIVDTLTALASLGQPSWVVASSWVVAVGNKMLDNVERIEQHSQGIVGMRFALALAQPSLEPGNKKQK